MCAETCRTSIADSYEQRDFFEISPGVHILPDLESGKVKWSLMTSRRNSARPSAGGYHIPANLESGKVKWSLARVNQVSKYFNCPPDYFYDG